MTSGKRLIHIQLMDQLEAPWLEGDLIKHGELLLFSLLKGIGGRLPKVT